MINTDEVIKDIFDRINYKKVIIATVAVALTWLLFFLATTYTLATIKVEVPSNSNSKNLQIVSEREGKKTNLHHIGELYLLRRDTETLNVSIDNYATISNISMPWYGYIRKDISVQKDRNAQLASGPTADCTTYQVQKKQLLSYNCLVPSSLLSATPPTQESPRWSNNRVATIPYGALQVTPYANGVIGFLPVVGIGPQAGKQIFYTDANNEVSYIAAPEELEYSQLLFSKIITDKVSDSNDKFLIVSPEGDTFQGTFTNEPSYKILPKIKDYSEKQDTTSCSLIDIESYCYYSPGRSAKSSKITSSVTVTNLSDNDSASKTMVVTKDTPIDTLLVTKNREIFAVSDNKLIAFKNTNTDLAPSIAADDVSNSSAGDSVVFMKDNVIYRFNYTTNEASLIFRSPNWTLRNVTSLGGLVIVSATATGTNTYHKLTLNETVNETGPRLIDLIPLPPRETTGIIRSELYQDSIFIQLAADITSDRKTGKISTDPGVFEVNKELALTTLRKVGIDPDVVKVNFSY